MTNSYEEISMTCLGRHYKDLPKDLQHEVRLTALRMDALDAQSVEIDKESKKTK